MSSVIISLVLSPIYIALAWAIYFGAKWSAAMITASTVDQTVMAVMAAVIVPAVVLAGIANHERY